MAGLPARAAEWPDRPIRLVVPSTPGSTPDIFARILGEGLRNRLKQPIVVENRPGAGGSIAVNTVARAEPSGYVIGITPPGPVVLNKLLYEKPSYDAAKDLSLISIAVRQPNVLVVRSSLGVDSLEGLLQRLHTEPNRFNYAMIGIGSINHLCMESVALKSGTEIAPITYNGTAQAVIALLAGEVDMACLPAQAVVQQVNAGKIRALAVATEDRSRFFPSVPSLKEAGIIGVDASAWMGIIAPASLPAPIVARLSKDIAAVLQAPDIRARLATQYMEVVASTPDQFATTVRDDSARWKPVIESRKIRLK
jgi:tripartite-type tricarboxylate transporter receptor subunit TctC